MNLTVCLSKELGERVNKTAKSLHRSRNSIVKEAVDEWLERQVTSEWPKSFFDFASIEEVPDFQATRKEFKT